MPGASPLSWPDYAVLGASLLFLLAIGGRFARQRDTADFFLARRHIPWWAAALSFLATEISAVTVISVPATAYSENWEYIQFFVGASLAKWAVAFLFIPAFYRYDVTTIYEFLGHRFGPRSQVAASILFFITRLAGSGVRLMAACLAVSVIFGWPLAPTIAAFSAVSIAYMAAGGVRAIIWSNVFQALMFLVAGGLTLAFVVSQVDGGLAAVVRVAGDAGRLNVVNWGPPPGAADFWRQVFGNPNIVWVALLSSFIGSMAAFGTDQDLMQRLLTVETRGQSQRTLSITPLGTALTLAIYLGLGAALFTYYAQHPGLPLSRPDAVLPHFVQQAMPAALRGLMLSAIVLASIDSPLGALSSSFVTDIYRPILARGRPERHYLWVSRIAVAGFGVALGGLAYGFSYFDRILWLAFKIAGVTSGSLLGVFLLGLVTRRRVADRANVTAMVVMAVVNLVLLVLIETGRLPLAWSWLVIIGTAGTALLAMVLTPRRSGPEVNPAPPLP